MIKSHSLANRSGADMNGHIANMRGNNYLKIRIHSLTPCQAQAPYREYAALTHLKAAILCLIWFDFVKLHSKCCYSNDVQL